MRGGGAEGVRNRQPLAAGIGNVQVLAEFDQGILFHQEIRQGEVKKLPQHMVLVALGSSNFSLHVKHFDHKDILSFQLSVDGIIGFCQIVLSMKNQATAYPWFAIDKLLEGKAVRHKIVVEPDFVRSLPAEVAPQKAE